VLCSREPIVAGTWPPDRRPGGRPRTSRCRHRPQPHALDDLVTRYGAHVNVELPIEHQQVMREPSKQGRASGLARQLQPQGRYRVASTTRSSRYASSPTATSATWFDSSSPRIVPARRTRTWFCPRVCGGRAVEVAGIEPAEPPVFTGLRRYSPAFSGHASSGAATVDQRVPRICPRVPAASASEPDVGCGALTQPARRPAVMHGNALFDLARWRRA
jgi:hypothetical protein